MTQDKAEMLAARERPDWQFLEVFKVKDESSPSFEIALARGGARCTLLVAEDNRTLGERH